MNTLTQPAAHPKAPRLDLPALLGESAWQRLPERVQRRFAPGHPNAEYHGRLDLRCSRLGRLIAWACLPLRGPLVPQCAEGVPAVVSVQATREGGVRWTRHMGRHEVTSVKSMHPEGGVLERTAGGLAMALEVFEDDHALVFQSRHYAWSWRGLYLRLPRWLSPGVCRVEHRDLGAGAFRFTLAITHPLWGETFHQTGVFQDPVEE